MPPIDGELILTWNGSGFEYFSYDSGFGGWIDANLEPAQPPLLPPGKGFFLYNPNRTLTVTFVGEVIPRPCQTNHLALPAAYSLIGSPLPADADPIDSPPVSLPLLDGMALLQWYGFDYDYLIYSIVFGGWVGPDLNPPSPPRYRIGEGFFFFNPGTDALWSQSLPCP
jgi:hypothetical protein